jgi:HEAT repeat protein
MQPKRKVTLQHLKKALTSKRPEVRYNAIFDFAHSDVSPDAIPTLLAALKDKSPGVVRYAAESLGGLGSAALNFGRPVLDCPKVIWELKQAACQVDDIMYMPQAYTHCLEAMVKLDPKNEFITGLIHDYIGMTNWYFIKASLQALKTIGTPEALDLLTRSVAFWMPELDKKQKRIVQEIVEGK